MNFDDLRDAWAKEKVETIPASTGTLPAHKTFSIVSKLRKNMKAEFIGQIAGYILVILIFLLVSKTTLSVFIVWISTFILFLQSAYYFYRFFLFYKAAGRYDLGIRHSIRKIIYELELNIEIYKTYSFCAMPLATLTGIAILGGGAISAFFREILLNGSLVRFRPLFFFCIIIFIIQIVGSIFLNLHIRLQYGGCLRELKKIMVDLETEEDLNA
jgi:hypothetical protein